MDKHYPGIIAEKQMQEFWEQEKIYKFQPDQPGELYSIDTPPPTVSGTLHIGHLFSYTQAEIMARSRRMQGYHVFYPFGFDDNGLPTERLVEKTENIRARDLDPEDFARKCRLTAENCEEEFRELFRSLGFSTDWSRGYTTVQPDVQKISQKLFLDLVKMKKAYLKESPVLWCTECRTSIAQAELDTLETAAAYYTLPFAAETGSIPVATTRPELLYGCVCLFVHPDDPRYQQFIGQTASVPLYRHCVPVYADEHVEPEKGTGAVMCATFGDSTDAGWYQTYHLPYRKVLEPDGLISAEVPFLGGMAIPDARTELLRRLEALGLLLSSESCTHTIAVHERCRTPVEILPSRQWYVDILTEKDRFLAAADQINWYPPQMKSRYTAWVENLKWDWCISRQRYFGVPFPVWYCKSCGEAVFAKADALPVRPVSTPYTGRCSCGCTQFVPETAVFDTWMTSSVTPQINERLGLSLTPMSMRTHAHEIIRTWTFYSIVRSLYHTGRLPWNDLMINGFILAKKGEKISKSKGNASDSPADLIAAHTADALRYWSASNRLGTDTFFSADDLQVSKRFLTKLWNASRFALSHLQDFDSTKQPELLPADMWILERLAETQQKVNLLLNEYEIGQARHEIDELFWKDFCDYYIEIVKERLYQPLLHGTAQRSAAQYALYQTLLSILKLYAPYVPHITEYLYQQYFRSRENILSIHCLTWNQPKQIRSELLNFGEAIKEAVSGMRRMKTENNLSLAAELEELTLSVLPEHAAMFEASRKDIAACAKAKKITILIQ